MIIIKLKKKIKSIHQHFYNKIVNSIHFNEINCPNCHNSDWYYHAYYYRRVDFFDRTQKILVLRVKCNVCGQTHAVLIEDMIPYSIASFDVIYNIVNSNDSYYSSYNDFIKHKYLTLCDYDTICLSHSKLQNMISHFSTQDLYGFFLFHSTLNS